MLSGQQPNKRVNLTRSTGSVVTWSRSPRRLRAVRAVQHLGAETKMEGYSRRVTRPATEEHEL